MAWRTGRRRSGFRFSPRLVIALVIALVSIVGYFGNRALNPVTGRTQSLALSTEQEVALGLQAAPEMAAQFGGLSRNAEGTRMVKDMGFQLLAVAGEAAQPYTWDFHLLGDQATVNAFALPGGQIFITEALLGRLQTPGQLAGVLGHEFGHVLARHSSEQLAKTQLAQGLSTSAVIAGSDSRTGAYTSAAVAQFVSQFALMRYSREHELESDRLGVRFMTLAGYDPNALKDVMMILAEASGRDPGASDFMTTHPSSDRRIQEIDEAIRLEFPEGLPPNLLP